MQVRIGAASRPAVGQTVSGDASVVVTSDRATLICLADGLGHGPEARASADAVCDYARAHPGDPLESLLAGMNAAAAGMRGAAVSLLSLEPTAGRAQFAGVGNVELRALARARISPPTTAGIVGHGVRRLRVWEYPLAAGDLLVLLSDGVSSRFELEPYARLDPQAIADALLAKHHKSHDDATCVVARVALPGAG